MINPAFLCWIVSHSKYIKMGSYSLCSYQKFYTICTFSTRTFFIAPPSSQSPLLCPPINKKMHSHCHYSIYCGPLLSKCALPPTSLMQFSSLFGNNFIHPLVLPYTNLHRDLRQIIFPFLTYQFTIAHSSLSLELPLIDCHQDNIDNRVYCHPSFG